MFAAPSASAYDCKEGHLDFTGVQTLWCLYGDGTPRQWSVPFGVWKATFLVYGAGESGGVVEAVVPLTPGDSIKIELGAKGAASVVSSDGIPLIVAGGADGRTGNYVVPWAEVLSEKEPGQTGSPNGVGWLLVSWQGSGPPAEPFFSVIYDFFADEADGFFPTGAVQTWTAPDNLEDIVFELRGGAGQSGFPEGHVIASFPVRPGESFEIEVGSVGEATTLRRARTRELIARAAGGDDHTVNFLAPWASGSTHYEGGGSEPFPWNGFAAVHQWMSSPPPPPAGDPPPEPEPKLPNDEAVNVSRPPAVAILPAPNAPVSAEGEPPRKAAPRHLSCRLRGRRVTQRRCRLLAGRLARQRAVAGRAASSKP